MKEKIKEMREYIDNCKSSGYCKEIKCELYTTFITTENGERIDLCDFLCEAEVV